VAVKSDSQIPPLDQLVFLFSNLEVARMPATEQHITTDAPSFREKFAGFSVSRSLLGLYSTLDVRIAHYDSTCDPACPEFEKPCIWLFWHEYIISPFVLWRSCDVTILVSQHRDGKWLTLAGEQMGFDIVRGSTNRGGTEAIRQLKKLSNSCGICITPDGPRGPRREMALGPIFLASRLGLPIVTTGFGFQNPWRLNSWDRFAIPRPGGRSRIVMGPKIQIPRKLDRQGLEEWRLIVQASLEQVTRTAEDWAASNKGMQNERPFQRRPNWNWRVDNEFEAPGKSMLEKAEPSTAPILGERAA
jgi:lysophospholipid acyltransferase (LPLAT)-like uncharacterized protein